MIQLQYIKRQIAQTIYQFCFNKFGLECRMILISHFYKINRTYNNGFKMNLQSPTTLLSSIHYMKNKLRNDKQTLNDIKNDFTRFVKKPKVQKVYELEQSPKGLADITSHMNQELNLSHRNSKSIDNPQRGKLIELKKQHSREIAKMKQDHQNELKKIIHIKDLQMQDLESYWRAKLQQQANYISILQEQVSSPIQSQREIVSQDQYDLVINKLLQDNTNLHHLNEQLKQECQKLKLNCSQMENDLTNRSRFKFSKARKDDSRININKASFINMARQSVANLPSQSFISEKANHNHKRANSIYIINDENVDTSNVAAHESWEDFQINDDEGCLKTIHQFQQSVLDERSHRLKEDGYLSLKI